MVLLKLGGVFNVMMPAIAVELSNTNNNQGNLRRITANICP
jgi:hypothetical protein